MVFQKHGHEMYDKKGFPSVSGRKAGNKIMVSGKQQNHCSSSFLYSSVTLFMTEGPGAPRVVRFSTQVLRLMAS